MPPIVAIAVCPSLFSNIIEKSFANPTKITPSGSFIRKTPSKEKF